MISDAIKTCKLVILHFRSFIFKAAKSACVNELSVCFIDRILSRLQHHRSSYSSSCGWEDRWCSHGSFSLSNTGSTTSSHSFPSRSCFHFCFFFPFFLLICSPFTFYQIFYFMLCIYLELCKKNPLLSCSL